MNDVLIPSGSLTPGIDPDMWGLPPGTALRFERPADAIRSFLPSYFVMASVAGVVTPREWVLPGWAMIWINFVSGPLRAEIGNRRYAALASSALVGATSQAMPVDAPGGTTIGVDVSPLGWARLFDQPADDLRDRIVPLGELLSPDFVEELYLELLASDRSSGVKAILDRLFLPKLAKPHRDEAGIVKLLALLEDERSSDFASATRTHDVGARSAARLARVYGGFPPKTLMMRARFLRALAPLLDGGEPLRGKTPPPGYYDRSHFNKDAILYLGMSPQRFIDLPSPYAAAVRRARRAVIGSPLPALDKVAGLQRTLGRPDG